MKFFHKRSTWSSNFVYILAAIGCAAGLGNLWRFPMLAYENGGGAFIVALLISNIFFVYPLLLTETVIGQKFRLSAPQAFEKFKKGTSWVQWIAIFSVFLILTYYTPIMGWALTYLFHVFNGAFLSNPSGYFTQEILHLTDNIQSIGRFQWPIFLAVLIGYGFVLFAMRKNVHSLSSVVKVTATAPFLLLFLFLIRGVTLPGASQGLSLFLIPDWSALGSLKLWQEAIGQSFFSASLALGYFFVAGSHRKEDDELPLSSLWILIGNFGVSLLSGLAVFSTLGFMAGQQGVDVSSVSQGGPMLVFSVLPTAISMMPTGAILFAILLFLIFFALAIDSIFGTIEALVGAINDHFQRGEKKFFSTLLWIVGILLLFSLPYLFGAGLYFLDIVDHFISAFMMLLVGIFESAVIAYGVGPEVIRGWINQHSNIHIPKLFNWILYIIPVVLSLLFLATFFRETHDWYGGYPPQYIIGLGFVPLVLVLSLSFFFHSHQKR